MRNRVRSIVEGMPSLLVPAFLRPGYSYARADFFADLVAGITVAAIQIPQAMAFALIAGLPAVYGLYASLPGFIASLWGSSTKLSTGPVAIVSLLTLTSLVPLAEPGTAEYIQLAALLALMTGVIYLSMGLLRLGSFVHLIPQSVIIGFSSTAAIIIIMTQLPTFLGVPGAQHDFVFHNITDFAVSLSTLSWPTFAVGLAATALLFASRLLQPFPGALAVILVAIVAGRFLDLGAYGIALVAAVPSSIPPFSFPLFSTEVIASLLPKAIVVALVGFVGAHAVAKNAAAKTKEILSPNQELIGQGLANIACGFFRGYPVSGSFTRTSINVGAGARTSMAGVFASITTLVVLLLFAPLFSYLPQAALAAIVITSALPLVDLPRLRRLYRLSRTDGYVAFLTFAMTFALNPSDAIAVGIVAAIMLFIHRTSWGARIYEMGVDREWMVLRSVVEGDRVETYPGVVIARFGMSLYYANVTHLIGQIDALIRRHAKREGEPVKVLALDCSGVHFIDATAMEELAAYIERIEKRGVAVAVIYLRQEVRKALSRMPDLPEITILHNISELKHFALPEHARMLVLSGSHPEKLGQRVIS